MFSSLTALPSSVASSTWSFLSNRRKTFTYLGATVGGAYAIGQWGLQRMMEASERGRKQTGAKNDLLNRFNLNLQDAQFTVQALLPTVANQLQAELDVEDRTTQLGEIAKSEKLARLKEVERVKRDKELQDEQERARRREEEKGSALQDPESTENSRMVEAEDEKEQATNSEPQLQTNGLESTDSSLDTKSTTTSKISLNPDAPAFQPRFAPPPAQPSSIEEDFPKLNGHCSDSASDPERGADINGHALQNGKGEATDHKEPDGSGLGRSWAEIVKTDQAIESVGNGQAELIEAKEREGDDPILSQEGENVPTKENGSGKETPRAQSREASTEPQQVAQTDDVAVPQLPSKSKIQLWNEIKILSFTRTLTSIYVLSLLTLQTHVQLALLGRAHYVKSLIDSLPPRSPSPTGPATFSTRVDAKGKGKGKAVDESTLSNDEDLEAALYKAKAIPEEREEDRVSEDVERKYLTFSWWLLHEGWKVVRQRVQEKVEEVVGPMGLKTPIVYGELSALMGEIRRRIETQEDGSRFDFSAALHPPTPADEVHTLVSGGGFSAPSSSDLSTSLISRPLRSLLNETSDFLHASDGALVLTLLLNRLFALSVSKLESAFTTPIAPVSSAIGGNIDASRGARFEDVTEKQTKLASLLPVLTRLSAAGSEGQAGVLRGGHGNDFAEAIDDLRELREFVAIVYSSYDRDNLRASY